MTVVLLCYLAFPATIFVLLRAFKVRDRKYLFGIPLVILCLSVLLGISAYVLRTPIQQGKLLPELGPLLNLAFPAQDLYLPLASEALSSQKKIYTFRVSHKYQGKHGVFIDIPGKSHVVTNTDGGLNLLSKSWMATRNYLPSVETMDIFIPGPKATGIIISGTGCPRIYRSQRS